ncbi:MAG: NAD(P)-binding protein [Proteobacteria bacterium]|nr:NAD(P)-binding protein [Pseudomonadota bacterium]
MLDVLVVGAGPVGLTMAAEAARYGLAVRIIDKAAHATTTSKALVLWSRTLELMDRMGCTTAFLDAGLRAHGVSMRHGHTILARTRLDSVPSAYNFALMIPQRETERLMAAHLAGFGIAVEREVELIGFLPGHDDVEAVLRHPDGREESVQATWLAGCDGAHSTVRHQLDLPFRGKPQGDDWFLADVRLEGEGAPPADEVTIYLHREGLFAIFPIPGGRARVIGTVGKADPAHRRPDPTLAEVQALADGRTAGGFRVLDPVWLTTFRVQERKVEEYRVGRVFLAGDAAHVHSPAGGQGMNTGMQDAINLAWKLAMAAKGTGGPALLDSYSPERSAVGDMVLRNATRLTDMATLANPAAQTMRNLAMRFVMGLHAMREKLASEMSETGIAYGDSPLSVGGRHAPHGLAAGERLAPAHYDGPPPGAGATPRFVLFASADPARAQALTAAFPTLLEAAPRRSPDRSRLLVVRPDGYIGLSAPGDDFDAAERYLHHLLD